jgi:hypothetical protein
MYRFIKSINSRPEIDTLSTVYLRPEKRKVQLATLFMDKLEINH